jgi:regulatory protein
MAQRSLLDSRPGMQKAMERAGRWLALKPRTERELTDRLLDGGFDPRVVADVVARLTELGLLDDAAFARQWVEERAGRKGIGGSLLVVELVGKGIDQAVAQAAVEEAGLDEAARARAVAASHLTKVAGLPLPRQAARIQALLLRRGFGSEVAEEATKSVLPPEGWD